MINLKEIQTLDNYLRCLYIGIFDKILYGDDVSDCCYVWGYTSHQPSLYIWDCYGEIKEKDHPLIYGYKIWLNFFCDYIGYNTSIYYPKSPKKGEEIKVFFIGAQIRGYIRWTHGELGLFKEIILPLLVIEKGGDLYTTCKTCDSTLYKDEDKKQFCAVCNPPF